MPEALTRTIVAGVDGSQGSVEALRWAVREARLSGATVRAITAWEVPATFGYIPSGQGVDWAGEARKALDNAIERATDRDESAPVAGAVVRGHAADVLIEASRTADLLVVGSRGHGSAVGLLLGSVSQHCVQHAECPVVVVRPRPE
ncbi:universal stress protein [Amycolatopsis rhizosphaerae]|uniref:Universal stress protein n=1 Tax=Amycolatopsis rhizosphaerae TaxID=2053003 RepID=A0A558AVT5_9PSEU|nr:universal stress protein [Amycolatopsis rhizosphaerae]TVT28363.1 universal stress protein [Amycolatopsis rhizosphaerae]